jgi:hypothetical protein
VGFDVSYFNMKFHQTTANSWSDLLLGPIARGHLPFRVGKFVLEPSLGVQVGYVKGVFHEKERENGTKVDWEHDHLGAFLAIPLGIDFFPIPKLGVGLEFKVVRTFYTEVCYQSTDLTTCRGVDDKALEDNWALPTAGIPNDKGLASYPWKLFWGIHGLYYF